MVIGAQAPIPIANFIKEKKMGLVTLSGVVLATLAICGVNIPTWVLAAWGGLAIITVGAIIFIMVRS